MLTTHRMRKTLGTRFYILKQIYNIINEYSRTQNENSRTEVHKSREKPPKKSYEIFRSYEEFERVLGLHNSSKLFKTL